MKTYTYQITEMNLLGETINTWKWDVEATDDINANIAVSELYCDGISYEPAPYFVEFKIIEIK